ncbi:hypothetical protein BT96DRAFT_914545 [Gymnopus androsaceus JB14]|uniref:Chitin-binding type-2 domain-containing protein n=1 Tax=Gymnopus androsaceus JB14 TaxID=1447944 RepID=A0A6A4IAE6_9AGAR|nr:hypothetical protein BT96DRAFT_914545 [Gymnopus androsaceus JB14]
MRFFTALAAFTLVVALPAFAAERSQPSSVASRGFICPETDKNQKSKIDDRCDTPPYSDSVFGCTFQGTTSSTSTLQCIYDVLTGDCLSADKSCPSSAIDLAKLKKRSVSPAAPVTSRQYKNRL